VQGLFHLIIDFLPCLASRKYNLSVFAIRFHLIYCLCGVPDGFLHSIGGVATIGQFRLMVVWWRWSARERLAVCAPCVTKKPVDFWTSNSMAGPHDPPPMVKLLQFQLPCTRNFLAPETRKSRKRVPPTPRHGPGSDFRAVERNRQVGSVSHRAFSARWRRRGARFRCPQNIRNSLPSQSIASSRGGYG
jgi:hypothetical protein